MSEMRVKTCVLGMVSTDCYIVYHDQTREAIVIDPADNSEYIRKVCAELSLVPKAILLTHGHFDHILAAADLRFQWDCPIYANVDEERLLQDPAINLSGSYGTPELSIAADYLVKDQEEVQLIGFTWKVLTTPGHTAGSTCYYVASEEVLFAGDTLFYESYGRTDLPTGNISQIVRSITDKLLVLPDNTMVYPGHGDPTTIAHEKQHNPIVVFRRH